mgnify:CR=1 FL=1
MATRVSMKIKSPLLLRGPKIVERAAAGMVRELVDLGLARLHGLARMRPGGVFLTVSQAGRGKASKGHYRRNIHGEVHGRVGRLHDSGVIYGPWLEVGAIGRTRFRGYAMFRRTDQWLNEKKKTALRAHTNKLINDLKAR